MEEHLTIIKNLRDRYVMIMNKNCKYTGPASTRQLFIIFSKAPMIPLYNDRVKLVKLILNPYRLKQVTLVLCTTKIFPNLNYENPKVNNTIC